MNIDNFDSGQGVEDIIREGLTQLLPARYSLKAGVITDRGGKTGGDFDVVVFNEQWFQSVKAGATAQSRRVFLPIEGVYAVCEVKQTLDFRSLDQAMEKLVVCHRLRQPRTCANRIVENRESSSCVHGLSNPLYSAIIATDLREGIELKSLIDRFFDINRALKRLEVVRALCVLGRGAVTWGFRDQHGEGRPALSCWTTYTFGSSPFTTECHWQSPPYIGWPATFWGTCIIQFWLLRIWPSAMGLPYTLRASRNLPILH